MCAATGPSQHDAGVEQAKADKARQTAELLNKLFNVLVKIPHHDRKRFARTQLQAVLPSMVRAFDSIPQDRLSKTVLFVSPQPHSRETRLATVARLAGWEPILLHLAAPKFNPPQYFGSAFAVKDMLQLVLASWLFPGELAHVFGLNGEAVGLLCLLKNCRTVIDLYDTCSGINATSPTAKTLEREAMRLADGMTHRDMRAKYLQRLHGYQLPRHNILIHDPLQEKRTTSIPTYKEIRVVSVGWVGSGDNSVLRVAEALAAHRIHLHVYFSGFQQQADPDLLPYRALAERSEYFHIENNVYGDAYWEQLSRYDFGLATAERFIFDEPWESYTADYIRGCGSSRVIDYIQMNLGVIVTPGLRFQHFWSRRFASATVSATRAWLDNPRPALERALEIKRRAEPISRSSITAEGSAKRFGEFYRQVLRG